LLQELNIVDSGLEFLWFVSFPDPEIISPFFFFKKNLCSHNVTEAGIDLTFPTLPVYW
jgi:hypothetical protein